MARAPAKKFAPKRVIKKPDAPPVKANPLGRPTLYRPEYCERVMELAAAGDGPAAYAVEFGIDRTTLYDWAAAHPDFSTALQRAKQIEQVWWERAGKQGLTAKSFNAVVWKTSMQARFRDDYTEKKVTEISGPDGAPVQMQSQVVDARALTEEQREILKQALLSVKHEGEKA